MAKDVVIKFKLDGVKDSVKDIISIQTAIKKIKEDLATGLSTEGFRDSTNALKELEAQYASLVGTVESANQDIQNSNSEMVSDTETASNQAGEAVDELANKHEEAADKTKKANEKAGNAAKDSAKNTTDSYKRAGDNIEKFAKGIVDSFAGVAIVFGSNKEEADKFAQNFAEIIGVAHGLKGGIEAATSGFEILKSSFPGVLSGLKAIWAVMLANPITSIIVGITALTGALALATDGFSSLSEEQKEAERISEALNESYEKQAEELQKINNEIAIQNDKHSQSLELQKKAEQAEVDQIKTKKELIDLNSKYDETVVKTMLTNEQLINAYKEIKTKQEEYNNQLIKESGAHLAFKKDADERVATLKHQLALKEELLKKSKDELNSVIGGPTVIGTNQTIEYNKTLSERNKIQEDLNWALRHQDEASAHLKETQDNLTLGSVAYNKETLNTLSVIEQTIRARGLQTEFDKQKAEQEKKYNEDRKKSAEDYKNKIKEEYSELQKFNEIQILKTQEGTDARIVAEDKAYFAQLAFMEKYKNALELSENDIALFKQKRIQEDIKREKEKREAIAKEDEDALKLKKEQIQAQSEASDKAQANELALLISYRDLRVSAKNIEKDELIALNKKIYDAQLNQIAISNINERNELEKALDEKKISYETYLKEIKNLDEKYYQQKSQLDQKTVDEQKKNLDKQIANITKYVNQATSIFSSLSSSIMGIWQAFNDIDSANREIQLRNLEDGLDASLERINNKRDEDLYSLEQHNQAALESNQAYYSSLLENENLSNEERQALQEAANAKEAQLKIDLANQKAQIEYEAAMAEYQAKLSQFEAEEKLKEEAFEADKRMKIAQTIINTITGAVAAFTGMLQSIPAPYGLIAGAIAAAGVAAMGAAQVAAISSTKYQKGKAPQAPKAPRVQIGGGAGGGGGESAKTAPSTKDSTLFSTAGGGMPQKAEDNRPQTVKLEQDQPIRAYVVTSDIEGALDKEAALKRKASGF